MDDSQTALTDSLLIWVSFSLIWAVRMRRFIKGSIESGFAYLFVGGESEATAEKELQS